MTVVVCPLGSTNGVGMRDEAADDSEGVATLRTTITEDADHLKLSVIGELDLSTVPIFVAGVDDVIAMARSAVELDLSELTFIDSSGVGAYVSAFRRARAAGVTLSVGPRSPFVERVLQISGVEDALAAESA